MPVSNVKGIKIYYDDLGKGIPIIFIHPPAMGRKVFFYQTNLADHFRVIFPDLSGHGDTVGNPKEVSIFGYAAEIVTLMDQLNIDKAVLCGYSSGGLVAQEFALSFPERSIAVILAGGYPEVKSKAFQYEHLLGMYFVKHFPEFLAKIISDSHTKNKQLQKDIFSHMLKADRHTWYRFYEESLHYSCVDRLNQLKAPLYLMYGTRDLVNQHLRCYKKHINFQSAIVKKVSHQLPTKKWQIFNQLITGFIKTTI
ncbi:alpha/beta fold hydrolase [Bacillus dakarensis]|uniref:alpha/beta fold hydrolase n=1 Tax=Robertmurraya dakarensis TaxID=1926278 RepID=UPI000981F050|nr:alpha/beta hydrolase [Bacillus dakarensis]